MTEILALLILLTVIAAIITVLTSNLLYAVISVGAVGFLLAIVFLFLAAPDVAIVQIGVEVVSLVILIRATLGREVQKLKTVHAVVGVSFAVAFVAVIGLFAVLLDFRAWDTLGEATVLFCAVLGAVSVLRRNARISSKKMEDESS
jgi:multisubunit Na+/H+ antiporter MnhB subunit